LAYVGGSASVAKQKKKTKRSKQKANKANKAQSGEKNNNQPDRNGGDLPIVLVGGSRCMRRRNPQFHHRQFSKWRKLSKTEK